MGKWRVSVSAALLAMVALTGCGGGESEGGADIQGLDEEIKVAAADNEFAPTELSVPDGKLTVTVTNTGDEIHTFTIKSLDVDTGNIEPGESKTVTFDAPDAETPFVCTIHEASDNMVGTIKKA